MKAFQLGALLLASTNAFAYVLDETCKTDSDDLEYRMVRSIREAKYVLEYAATISAACAVNCEEEESREDAGSGSESEIDTTAAQQLQQDLQFSCGDGGGDMERRKAATSLIEGLLGSESKEAWKAIHTATNKAAQSVGTSSDGDSDGVRIFCSDKAFTKQAGVWKDRTGRIIDLGPQARAAGKRPCDGGTLGLAITSVDDPTKKGILLCNRPRPGEEINSLDYNGIGVKHQDYLFSTLNRIAESDEMPINRLTMYISSELIHEMIHLGDSNQFPLEIGPKVHERYRYEGCREIAGTEMKWKNCDTFALIAQAIYMNAYYTDGDKLKRRPDNLIPPPERRNKPLIKPVAMG